MTITKSQRFDKTDKESKEGYEKVTTRSYQAKITLEKVNDDNSARASANAATMSSKLDEAKQTIENVKKSMQKRPKYEFGGPFGVLFQYLFVPFITIAVVSSFGKKKSELLKFSLKDVPQDWRAYYDPTAVIIVVEFLLFHAVLYALPVGNIIQGPKTYSGKKTEYRMHAFHCLVLTVLTFCGLKYMEFPILLVHDKMLQICATCIVFSFLFNFLLHFKSYSAPEDELNPKGNTGCTIYDVFMGRELHPKIGRYYHLKLLLYRPGMTAWILINLIYLQKEFDQNHTVRPAVGILAGAQIVYCVFVYFWDESQAVFSFDIKNEALGFTNLIGNLAIVPFVYTSPIRFLVDHPKASLVQLPMLVTATILLAVGFALVILSSYQKTSFRQNPYDPSLSAIESIPPSKKGGSRLITSGYWGFVRHPNYLGEILLGIGYGLMCGFSDIMPWVYVIFVIGLLVHRSERLEERSRESHGYAWSEYCKRVRYRILPYVF